MVNYYDVLDVQQDATEQELKDAWKREVLKWHTDKNDSPEAEVRTKQINEARSVLFDPESRKQYDTELAREHEADKGDPTFFTQQKATGQAEYSREVDDETLRAFAELISQITEQWKESVRLGKELVLAAYKNNWGSVAQLIKNGAALNERLDENILSENKLLPLNPGTYNPIGMTALHIASVTGNNVAAQNLISFKVDVNAQGITGYTPLHIAASQGNIDLVKILRESNAFPHFITREKGYTALHLALICGRLEVASYLIQNHSCTRFWIAKNINSNNRETKAGNTPLYLAIRNAINWNACWWGVVNEFLQRPETKLTTRDTREVREKGLAFPEQTYNLLVEKYNTIKNEENQRTQGCLMM